MSHGTETGREIKRRGDWDEEEEEEERGIDMLNIGIQLCVCVCVLTMFFVHTFITSVSLIVREENRCGPPRRVGARLRKKLRNFFR